MQGVQGLAARKIALGVVDSQHRRACVDYVEAGIVVIQIFEEHCPVPVFMDFVEVDAGDAACI